MGLLAAYLKTKPIVSKKKNPLFVRGWDRKFGPSESPFVISGQNGDPQAEYFIPCTLTLMIYSYMYNPTNDTGLLNKEIYVMRCLYTVSILLSCQPRATVT